MPVVHGFTHQVSVSDGTQIGEIERFMALTHPGINKNWVRVALNSGDRCVIVRLADSEIAGVGWLSLVNRIGRLHSLYVKPQFRRSRIGEDLLFARLFWLKSKRARFAFSEIARENLASARIAMKGGMKVSGQVYQYTSGEKDPGRIEKKAPLASRSSANRTDLGRGVD